MAALSSESLWSDSSVKKSSRVAAFLTDGFSGIIPAGGTGGRFCRSKNEGQTYSFRGLNVGLFST